MRESLQFSFYSLETAVIIKGEDAYLKMTVNSKVGI